MTAYSPFAPRRQSPLPLVIAGAAFALATYVLLDRGGWFAPTPKATPRAVTPRGELSAMEASFVEVFERCAPSVASINTSSRSYTRWGGVSEQQGAGSGFVWDDAGIVVTNHHVVTGAQDVQVTVGGRNFRADVVATSADHDLAVLRLRGSVQGLTPLSLGTSSDLRVGQTVIAIGNPFGFDQTMTTGIVSAVNRTIQAEKGALLQGLVQVDAAINRGNSGGPLLDSAGRLIGVTTAIYSPSGTSAGIGFAVPVDVVNEVIPQLLSKGVGVSALGVPKLGVRNLTENLRSVPFGDYDLGYTHGAVFTEVADGMGAAAAGLQPTRIEDGRVRKWGDVLVAIDGRQVRTFDEIAVALRGKQPGQKVKVTLVRGLPDAANLVDVVVELKPEQ